MMSKLLAFFNLLSLCILQETLGFSIHSPRANTLFKLGNPKSIVSCQNGRDDETVECFITNYDLVQSEGAIPEVVCTTEPDEYAWFNGIDRTAIHPANGITDSFLECVETMSPRGVQEWECRPAWQ